MIVNNNVEFDNIKIYNGDCLSVMKEKIDESSVDIVLTSPPYNNSRTSASEETKENLIKSHTVRYDFYVDNKTNDEYYDWTVELFNSFDRILKKNGVVLYNISYGNQNPDTMWLTVADIIRRSNFMCADCIIWKKGSALPNNISPNKLTRITEFVFVFCRKNEFDTFICNKKVTSVRETGQKMYGNIFNFIEAKNNDESCPLNKATYSSELCEKLLRIYAPINDETTVFDPFMGTGTTAVACERLGIKCFGSEMSQKQMEWANDRIEKERHIFNASANMTDGELNLFSMM